MSTQDDIDVDLSRMYREAERKVREGQNGEAFADLEARKPLLTRIVPDGMPSLLRKRP